MRKFIEGILRTVDPPSPERAERLWAEYRTGGPKADTAFATLMAWYGGTIYRRIWGFVRSDAADDVFQDVLVRLHRRRHRFTDFEHALRWLRGVAMTQSLNARRGESRRTARERTRAVAGGTATSEAATAELGEAFRVALAKLPDREREAVALVYFEGMTRQNAAAILGVHRDTMAKLLETALGRLKSALTAAAAGVAVTTAGVETALAVNPGMSVARLAVLAEAASVNACGPAFAWLPTRKLVPILLAGGLLAVAAAATLSWSRFMARTPTNVRLQVSQLEPREVPSADFVSALSLGSDDGFSESYDVAVDATGNSYKTGYFSGTIDFDPTGTRPGDADILTSAGGEDAFVAKYAPDNSLVWAIRMGGGSLDRGRSISVDTSGNVYVAGQFNGGNASFGAITLTSAGVGNDGFVTKLNPIGVVQWAKRWGQTDTSPGVTPGDLGLGVDTDAAGNVYVLGSRTGSPTSANGYDILKFSATGASTWSKSVNARSAVGFYGDLKTDVGGNVFVTGAFSGTVDFDPAANKTKNLTGVSSGSNAFVLKLTAAGNFDWASSITYAAGTSLTLDGTGNAIFGGYTYSGNLPKFSQYGAQNLLLPTNLSSTGGGFVAKLNSGGGLTWAKGFEANYSTTKVQGVTSDAAGSVYVTGQFRGSIDLNPDAGTLIKQSVPHSNGTSDSDDMFVVKLTSAGNLTWAETFGANYNDVCYGIAVDSSGFIHLGGGYSGTVDFDPDPNVAFDLTNATAQRHMFFVKLRSN